MPVNFAQQGRLCAIHGDRPYAAIPPRLRGNESAPLLGCHGYCAARWWPFATLGGQQNLRSKRPLVVLEQLFHCAGRKVPGCWKATSAARAMMANAATNGRALSPDAIWPEEDEPHTTHHRHTGKRTDASSSKDRYRDRKPDVQMFYDTCRDWVRTSCRWRPRHLYAGGNRAR